MYLMYKYYYYYYIRLTAFLLFSKT